MASIISAGTSTGTALNLTGDTSGILQLASNNGTVGLTMDTSQNVGIGTSSPSYTNAGRICMTINGSTDSVWTMNYGGTVGLYAQAQSSDARLFTTGTLPLLFGTGSAERMRIDSSGNVGIGTTSPACKLDINKGSAGLLANFTDGVNANFQVKTASLIATIGPAAGSTSFAFQSSNTEAMRINSSGNVGINTTDASGGRLVIAQSNSAQPAIYFPTDETTVQGPGTNTYLKLGNNLSINGGGQVSVRTGTTGGVYLSSGATSWTAVSDETTKENLSPIVDAVNKINTLRAVTGNYIDDETKQSRAFLIAQDVQKVLPEAVNKVDGILGLQYADVIPLLVASIKELNAKVDAQAAEIKALKGTA